MTSVKKEGGTIAVKLKTIDILIQSLFPPFYRRDQSYHQGTSVYAPLLPLLLLLLPGLAIAFFTSIYSDHPLLFCLLFGIIGSKITNRLIVSN